MESQNKIAHTVSFFTKLIAVDPKRQENRIKKREREEKELERAKRAYERQLLKRNDAPKRCYSQSQITHVKSKTKLNYMIKRKKILKSLIKNTKVRV